MENQITANADSLLIGQVAKQLINAWTSQNERVTAFFNKYSDDAYLREVTPGRNRAIYLLGHLVAVNDGMLPLFGLGEKLFPQLAEPFLSNPDKAIKNIPSVAELKKQWGILNTALTAHFNKMKPHEWLDRHTSVSVDDFMKDPLRNKLNVLISRTNHQCYHLGQLNLLKPE